ncbi:NADH-ubiquinone oxidoreductase 9.5 kDa subunit [Plectosphaerella cucumerina]|uniref:NADH-ubiquinone oxidoreductase 9.5 kDa subunit n=1 Tax=Plectosphaerella cucumerina TaxID=40658 RepID=A0A8K0TLD3_9PEZI|nr:NADH-ubiquinone oxidoreductase 9.5 kDa subunit [Plectosphaerella cucumerina]
MNYGRPRFWATPLRYLRWASRESPAYFWSVTIAGAGLAQLVVVPPFRRLIGDADAPEIPLSYPIPEGPRKKVTGYDDE